MRACGSFNAEYIQACSSVKLRSVLLPLPLPSLGAYFRHRGTSRHVHVYVPSAAWGPPEHQLRCPRGCHACWRRCGQCCSTAIYRDQGRRLITTSMKRTSDTEAAVPWRVLISATGSLLQTHTCHVNARTSGDGPPKLTAHIDPSVLEAWMLSLDAP